MYWVHEDPVHPSKVNTYEEAAKELVDPNVRELTPLHELDASKVPRVLASEKTQYSGNVLDICKPYRFPIPLCFSYRKHGST